MSTVRITTRYLTGDRWNSNSGGVRATALGRQRTVRYDAALGMDATHQRAAGHLAAALRRIGVFGDEDTKPLDVVQVESNDSGSRRVFEVVAP